ncbi:unnamed protein product [Prunus armeniaca]|uniref:Uncharacterized protein n=1 Tax=Prunus armeniaca TaxID=36596 RepID=A0A6J5XH50_PRUAR|nr:unnamed protein product [Prunus armeniaca]CAB4313256.1 unnamed protein product [Prunus armeniaca]
MSVQGSRVHRSQVYLVAQLPPRYKSSLGPCFSNLGMVRNVSTSHTVTHLNPSKSDHLPLLLSVGLSMPRKSHRKHHFRFEEAWSKHADCVSVVKEG